MELLAVREDRPSVVPHQGGRVFIAVHDQEYLRQKAAWKQRVIEAHPDRGGSEWRFRKIQKAREQWEAGEIAWYRQYGLTPPPVGAGELPKPDTVLEALERLPVGRGRAPRVPVAGRQTSARRLLALLADGRSHTVSECRAVTSAVAMHTAVHRLRHRGFDVRLELPYETGLTERSYRLRRTP